MVRILPNQTIEVALASCQGEPQHGARGANCKMLPEAKHGTPLPAAPAEAPRPTFSSPNGALRAAKGGNSGIYLDIKV